MRRLLAPVLLAFALTATAVAQPRFGARSGLVPQATKTRPIVAKPDRKPGSAGGTQLLLLKSAKPPKGVTFVPAVQRRGMFYKLRDEREVSITDTSVKRLAKGKIEVTLRFVPVGETWSAFERTFVVPAGQTSFYFNVRDTHFLGEVDRSQKTPKLSGFKVGLDQK